ncbi:NAD-dependent epimerase/dehydratase family protein [Falsarthrobacter nasiphocae]|uniref:Nucleoside-diphosphate-sugar epimerase n=1 Tax=Falsarthrobacter nasiphocae TaxID=189863 RepID=A0AAE3YI92_9MICC|nr:NAD-dependent epimerase/dehydratase family protein [Falsarthrobacter nasiphocae]MDR6892767.1 nucleoside-diphosphate-sugar epimerase [Falsarthrobacter nasiphocae]
MSAPRGPLPSHAGQAGALDAREAARRAAGTGPLTIAVVGASGFVGRHVAAEAEARGHRVLRVRAPRLDAPLRGGRAPLWREHEALAHRAAEFAASLTVPADAARALGRADIVINAAGLARPDGAAEAALLGANAVLPPLLARASGAPLIHLSSAAVLGDRPLTSAAECAPFSDYSASKAAGELALDSAGSPVCIVRATSVQGPERATTRAFARLACSPAGTWSDDAPTPLTSALSLARLTVGLAEDAAAGRDVPRRVLQPWEGATTRSALDAARTAAGLGPARRVPAPAARAALWAASSAGRVPGPAGQKASAAQRRLELLWRGQPQTDEWPRASLLAGPSEIHGVLADTARSR